MAKGWMRHPLVVTVELIQTFLILYLGRLWLAVVVSRDLIENLALQDFHLADCWCVFKSFLIWIWLLADDHPIRLEITLAEVVGPCLEIFLMLLIWYPLLHLNFFNIIHDSYLLLRNCELAVRRFLSSNFLFRLFLQNLLVKLVVEAEDTVLVVVGLAWRRKDWLWLWLYEDGRLADFLVKLIADAILGVIANH